MPSEFNSSVFICGLSFLINLIFAIFILHSHRERKRTYKMLNDINTTMSEKNSAISEQAIKLSEAYENLWKINQRLDDEVNFRTDKITMENKELFERTHFMIHKLRGQLASILGLLLLLQKEEMSPTVRELIRMISISTRELEAVVREYTRRGGDV